MGARLFTRTEADQLLPQLAPLAWEMRDLKRKHDAYQAQVAVSQEKMKGNGQGVDVDLARAQQGLQQTAARINEIVARINEMGAEVKDIEMGLLDFRSTMDGRVVYLCWKLGEEQVAWWHELDTGYASRQALGDL